MQSQYQKLLARIQKPYKNSDKKLIAEAFAFAKKAHEGQKRASGEEYVTHPLNAALTLSEMEVDAKTVAAALLHDVLDDTAVTGKELEDAFGSEIAFLVEGVSKLGKIKYRGVERHAENLRKMLVAMARDFRVVLIKLADRYHNLKTLDALPEGKQRRIALESLEIYAPLAFRFGVSELSKKIEDLSFKHCYPKEYEMIIENVRKRYPEREKYLSTVKPYLWAELIKEGINPLEIQTRAKHHWSLYEKLKRYNMNWDKVHDLVAMRVIVKTIEDCYAALGIIHKLWRPLPEKIKDYIALPKPNGYQSLHTTVFCRSGYITEFQIRTKNMHELAENGIASHWLYRESGKPKRGVKMEGRKFEWITQLKQWQREVSESTEFLENLKIDIFSSRIFVFTPIGDVLDLPEGATPIDFAYSIHSNLGDSCSQAKVNGEIVPLDKELKNGDVVEIIKGPRKAPSRDWLNFIKTSAAKSRIRAFFKKARREENVKLGENLLNIELEKLNQPSWKTFSRVKKERAFLNLPFKDEQSLLASVGEGNISPFRVIKCIVDEKEILAQKAVPGLAYKKIESRISKSPDATNLRGITTRIARCCSPIPGEKIGGYIAKNAYAAIHKVSCANFKRLSDRNPARIIPVNWQANKGMNFSQIKIAANDRIGLLQEISSTISNMGINMLSITAKQDTGEGANLTVMMEIFDIDQLHLLMKKLDKVRSVKQVKRI